MRRETEMSRFTSNRELATRTRDVERTLAQTGVHLSWEADFRTRQNEAFYERYFSAVLKALDAPRGATILDAGCGIAAHSVRLARHGYHLVEGVDFSPPIVEAARENVRSLGLEHRITIREANLRSLPYPDAHFGYAVCQGVLMHVPNIDPVVDELARVIRVNGKLVIGENNMHALQPTVQRTLAMLTGRRGDVRRTDLGIEKWRETEQGSVFARQNEMPRLIELVERRGFRLLSRRSAQFTELYTRAQTRTAISAIHALNTIWFELKGPAPLSFGNVLILERA
jgi:ubiquinone/menaquinone biosynthesis C-methylase UbiE